jgi:hypothetical protein
MLFLAPLHAARNVVVITIVVDITPAKHAKVRAVAHHVRVGYGARTTAKRQVINGVKQVCLALAVVPDEAIEFRREGKVSLAYILIIHYRQFAEKHELALQVLVQSYLICQLKTKKVDNIFQYSG